MSQDIENQVLEAVAAVKRLPADKLALDSSLAEVGLDSLDTIILLSELEKKFGIAISDDEAKSVHSLRDIAEGVRRLVSRNRLDAAAAAE